MSDEFVKAREFLVAKREDYEAAYRGFDWPRLEQFNWALDFFDRYAEGNRRTALYIVDDSGGVAQLSFAELRERSNRLANYLRGLGASRGDRLMLMLPNSPPIWEITLAAMKLGVVVTPTSTALTRDDLDDRFERGGIRHVVADPAGAAKLAGLAGGFTRIVVGGKVEGWHAYEDAFSASASFVPDGPTRVDDPLLLYFTSGTTAKPKLVLHTHQSYPIGHLTTPYLLGLKEGDVHLNISAPGWAKHAWSSFFAPWNAGATVFVHNYARFEAKKTLQAVVDHGVTTMCAPPTVWRLMILEDLAAYPIKLREVLSAGEPLNPEVFERVRAAWGLSLRDFYGQTETTALVGNSPGQPIKPGSMGRQMPGYQVVLLDAAGRESDDGEISLRLHPRPVGLMLGYLGDAAASARAVGGDYYRTGDLATRDRDGYFTYVGRADDVFKSSDYRISPFELESALIEHPAVAEAAVVPAPDAIRGTVPKAFLGVKPGQTPSAELAADIFRFLRERVAPFRRVRRLEFADLPKTSSGKIRRVQLRALELERQASGTRGEQEYHEEEVLRR
jgi:acetyl-CoA synthetase